MARLEFSRKVRRAIFERAAGRCEACRANLKVGEGEIDHRIPDALGGKPEIANGWLLCHVCHGNKSRADIQRIRKADRMRDKNTPAIRPKGSIRSAGFPRKERTERQALPPRRMYVTWPACGAEESGD